MAKFQNWVLRFHEKILEYNFWQEKWHKWKWRKNLKTYSVFSLEIGFCFMVVGVTRMVWATFWFFKVTMPPLPRVKVHEGFFNSGLFGVNFWILGGIWQTKGDFFGEVFGFSKSTEKVNLCQKHLFLYHLTHNMTTDCSLNYKFSTWKLQAQNLLYT